MSNDFHRSTQRAIDIMRFVARHNTEGLTMTELSILLDAPKSSLFSIIHTLRQNDILFLDETTGKFRLGLGIYLLAQTSFEKDHIQPLVYAEMQNVTRECRETCYFGTLSGGDVLYLLKVDSPEPLRMVSQGNKLPAYCTGIGKALLSEKSPSEIEDLYPDGLKPLTEHTVTDMDRLNRQLGEIRKTGISFECEESTPYVRCIGVPIRDRSGVWAALSVAVPVFRYNEEKEKNIIALLKKAADTLSHLLWDERASGLFKEP